MTTRTGTSRSPRRSLADRIQDRLPGPLRRTVARARGDDILLISAGLAFYALVSIAPLVILTMWITGLVVGEGRIEQFADQLGKVAPKNLGVDQAIRQIADQGTRLGLVAVAFGIWPATAYGSGLVRAFERLTPTGHDDRRRTPLLGRGLVLLVLLPAFVLGSLVAAYAGTQVLGGALVGQVLGIVLALVLGFLGAALTIALIYRLFPPDTLSWREVAASTAFTAAGVSVLSVILAVYLNVGANFEDHYASSGLTAVVFLAVWLFLSNTLLLVGYKAAVEN